MHKNKLIEFHCDPEFTDILIAELGEKGFDTFQETATGFITYHTLDSFDASVIDEIVGRYSDLTEMKWSGSEVEQENWNKEWESNYEPISIGNKVYVRADFHPSKPDFEHEIIINPRMSFGTGHHETTYLVLSSQLEIDHKGKKVLDAGCGTAILAVMAGKLGAAEIVAYDNDDWVIDNALENLELNQQEARVLSGVLGELNLELDFDIILANINKNILLGEMSNFSKHLSTSGTLVLSGFYDSDLTDLIASANIHDLEFVSSKQRNSWVAATFRKRK